jgi:hypothetical protein
VLDYRHGERTAKDMKIVLENNEMPNFSERATSGQHDLDKAMKKAEKCGMSVALLFTSKLKTSPLLKFLSTEFRRRLLLVEIPPTANNQPLLKQYGDGEVTTNDKATTIYEAIVVTVAGGDPEEDPSKTEF